MYIHICISSQLNLLSADTALTDTGCNGPSCNVRYEKKLKYPSMCCGGVSHLLRLRANHYSDFQQYDHGKNTPHLPPHYNEMKSTIVFTYLFTLVFNAQTIHDN